MIFRNISITLFLFLFSSILRAGNSSAPAIYSLYNELLHWESTGDPKAESVRTAIENLMTNSTIVRESPSIKLGGHGPTKKVYELSTGDHILQKGLDRNGWAIWLAVNGVLAYEVSKILKMNVVPITVWRSNGTTEGSAMFVFPESDIVRKPNFQNQSRADMIRDQLIGLLDWIINQWDRHEMNKLHIRIKNRDLQFAIDNDLANEPYGGFDPIFNTHIRGRQDLPLSPLGDKLLPEVVELIQKWTISDLRKIASVYRKFLPYRFKKAPNSWISKEEELAAVQNRLIRLMHHFHPAHFPARESRVAGGTTSFVMQGPVQKSFPAREWDITNGHSRWSFKLYRQISDQTDSGLTNVTVKIFYVSAKSFYRLRLLTPDGIEFFRKDLPRATSPRFIEFRSIDIPPNIKWLEARMDEPRGLPLSGQILNLSISGSPRTADISHDSVNLNEVRHAIGDKILVGDIELEIEKEIGSGASGIVFLGKWKDGSDIVLKIERPHSSEGSVTVKEPIQLEHLKSLGLDVPDVRAVGKNYLIKEFAEGIPGNEWLKLYLENPENRQRNKELKALIRFIGECAVLGFRARIDLNNFVLSPNKKWRLFDPSRSSHFRDPPLKVFQKMMNDLTGLIPNLKSKEIDALSVIESVFKSKKECRDQVARLAV